jgi:hypothetical protein
MCGSFQCRGELEGGDQAKGLFGPRSGYRSDKGGRFETFIWRGFTDGTIVYRFVHGPTLKRALWVMLVLPIPSIMPCARSSLKLFMERGYYKAITLSYMTPVS